ncbi:hypothetical protein M409DRAFT_26284 [Zasmidium cellare ATCC 36951]|uniref:Uncharacterized protein n=1 Tax=Zasmidium cellare ATCC 36951 TaxID=1080233 RepID=A0A6A6CAJ0_ZASCE|nr:uncharacterized protein M409DRAFT_26284 [Zasmidium cellare ATCC 36951]KAF2163240.1 hypothetical protein M409DRAFT_26284 [Zasmidium cellare ATCC 36951]
MSSTSTSTSKTYQPTTKPSDSIPQAAMKFLLLATLPLIHAATLHPLPRQTDDDCRRVTLPEAQSFITAFSDIWTRTGDWNTAAAEILSEDDFAFISSGGLSFLGRPV